MFASEHVSSAMHWWAAENNVDNEVDQLVTFLFQYLDALYLEFRQNMNTLGFGRDKSSSLTIEFCAEFSPF